MRAGVHPAKVKKDKRTKKKKEKKGKERKGEKERKQRRVLSYSLTPRGIYLMLADCLIKDKTSLARGTFS